MHNLMRRQIDFLLILDDSEKKIQFFNAGDVSVKIENILIAKASLPSSIELKK